MIAVTHIAAVVLVAGGACLACGCRAPSSRVDGNDWAPSVAHCYDKTYRALSGDYSAFVSRTMRWLTLNCDGTYFMIRMQDGPVLSDSGQWRPIDGGIEVRHDADHPWKYVRHGPDGLDWPRSFASNDGQTTRLRFQGVGVPYLGG